MMHSNGCTQVEDIRVAGVSYVEQEVSFPATSICSFITGKEFSSLVNKEQEKLKTAIKLAQLQTESNLDIYSISLLQMEALIYLVVKNDNLHCACATRIVAL